MTAKALGVTAPWVLLFFLAFYLLTLGNNFFISDGEVMYQTTERIARDHRLSLPANPGLPQIVPGRDGKYYSKYGLGQPLVSVALFEAGRWVHGFLPASVDVNGVSHFFVSLLNQLVTALACLLVYLIGRLLYDSRRLAVGLALLFGLGTMAWPYSRFFFAEPLFGLGLLVAAYALLRAPSGRTRGGMLGWCALAGAALGLSLLTKVAGVVLLPAFLAYLIVQIHAWQRKRAGLEREPTGDPRDLLERAWAGRGTVVGSLAALGLGAAPFAVALLAHNYLRFGNPLDNGYAGESFTTPLYSGLYGLLFSPGKGIIFFAPVVVLAPFAWPAFRRRWPAEAWFYAAVSLLTLFYYAGWWAWYGGWSWGPRFLLPILPFLVLPLGAILRQRAVAALAFGVLLPLGIAVQVLGVAVDFNTYIGEMMAASPANEIKYLFYPQHSPILAHLQAWRPGDPVPVASFALDKVGFPRRVALAFPLVLLGALVASMLALAISCLREWGEARAGVRTDPVWQPARQLIAEATRARVENG